MVVAESQALLDAMVFVRENKVRHLPIVDNGALAGLITDRDLKRATPSALMTTDREAWDDTLRKTPLAVIMSSKLITVGPDSPVKVALQLLVDEKIVSVGTTNLDNRSCRLNFEATAVVFGGAPARTVAELLGADFARRRSADARDRDEHNPLTGCGQVAELVDPLVHSMPSMAFSTDSGVAGACRSGRGRSSPDGTELRVRRTPARCASGAR